MEQEKDNVINIPPLCDGELESLITHLCESKTYYDVSFAGVVKFLISWGLSESQVVECIRRVVAEKSYDESGKFGHGLNNSCGLPTPQSGTESAPESKQTRNEGRRKEAQANRLGALSLDVSNKTPILFSLNHSQF